jgi:hypothetical protein
MEYDSIETHEHESVERYRKLYVLASKKWWSIYVTLIPWPNFETWIRGAPEIIRRCIHEVIMLLYMTIGQYLVISRNNVKHCSWRIRP